MDGGVGASMSYTKGRKVYAGGDSDVVKEWGDVGAGMCYTLGSKVYAGGDSDVVMEWGWCRCEYELY